MKLLGDGLARAGVTERFQAFHVVHLGGKFFQERSLHIAVGNLVLGDHGILAATRKHGPNLRRERLVGGQTFGLGEGFQGFLRIFAELAVNFPGGELSPVQKNLGLHDGRIGLVLGSRL